MPKNSYVSLMLLLFSISINNVYSQDFKSKYAGTYRDYSFMELILAEDGTFSLTYGLNNHQGQWVVKENEIILNPELSERYPTISISEQRDETIDSIEIGFNYRMKTYKNEILVECTDYEFDILAVYYNKPKHFVNVVRQPLRSTCMFAPPIRKQVVLHPTLNTIKLKKPKSGITKIGVHAPHFNQPVEINVVDPNSNRFELFIVHPVDEERMPRSKSVIIKGNRAYFYERNGKVDTRLLATPLLKVREKQ